MSPITAPALPAAGTNVVASVRVAAPWYLPQSLIASQFARYVPEYERLAGLERKLYTLGDGHRYGGIYLWATKAQASAFYTTAWREAIQRRRGADPDLRLWDAPYILEGEAQVHGRPLTSRSQKAPLSVTLALFESRHDAPGTFNQLAATLGKPEGLVRCYLMHNAQGQFGMVTIWQAQKLARAFMTTWQPAAQRQFGHLVIEAYTAPISMNPAP